MLNRTSHDEERLSTVHYETDKERDRRRHWNQFVDLCYILGAVLVTCGGLYVILTLGKHQ